MTAHPQTGCVIGAPHSGAGKTLVTLGILRALKRAQVDVSSAKVGPDYIDPAFHTLACGNPCINLDIWAMGTNKIKSLAHQSNELLIIEGVMGLFDGADDRFGSTADVAMALGLPVILIVDAKAQSFSAAALLHGFKTYNPQTSIAGVIFNRVGSERHASLLGKAAETVDVPVLGFLPRDAQLTMPSRHLGLVQAGEHKDINTLIDYAADKIDENIDLDLLSSLCQPPTTTGTNLTKLSPLGQRIAIAKDEAFAFSYQHLMDGWHEAGAVLLPFSPLNDEAPDETADAIFLPGGYPELHAGKLAGNSHFLAGLHKAADSALIYGECGGFMVLGDTLIDAEGKAHRMAGLLPVTTSFENPKRHLGYRKFTHESPLPWPRHLRGHEFHYSTLIGEAADNALFQATDSRGENSQTMGLFSGRIMGSYAHVISPEWKDEA